jgi:elongation factor Ts
MSNIEKIKELRAKTGISLVDCKKALIDTNFNLELAYKFLQSKIEQVADNKLNRQTNAGTFGIYTHNNSTIVGIVELLSETDFVSKTVEFKELAKDLAAQIIFSCSVKFISDLNIDEIEKHNYSEEDLNELILLRQPFYKDPSITINSLLKQYSTKFGEKIQIINFYKFSIN